MEKGYTYSALLVLMLMLILAGSIKQKFQPVKFFLSLAVVLMVPGFTRIFAEGLMLLLSVREISVPTLAGFFAGVFVYRLLLKRWVRLATFEHELSHALVALLFFRKIKKFVVTSARGGYVQYTEGFGGTAGNYFISLAPYFLPVFTIISILVRPLLPGAWFPWYDIWIGATFSCQIMHSIRDLRNNWTNEKFRSAGSGSYTHTDIGKEGFIFSFILIASMKLFITGILLFVMTKGYLAIWEGLSLIWKESLNFYMPVFAVLFDFMTGKTAMVCKYYW